MKNLRESLVIFLIFLMFFVFAFKLYSIQIKKADYYKALAQGLSNKKEEIKRGKIYFKNKEVLATNLEKYSLYFFPEEINEQTIKNFEKILKILNLPKKELKKKEPILIKDDVTMEEIKKLEKEKINGIFYKREIKRVYPKNEIACHLLGFVNKEGNGQYGLEEYFEKELSSGNDLILTLEAPIQIEAERILAQKSKDLGYEKGEILVLDPFTGKILALANFPFFNPNAFNLSSKDLSIFKNFSTQELFEPGSSFKPITFATALDLKRITPQEEYFDEGKVKIGGWEITNFAQKKYGRQNMTNVLEKSINTGAVYVVNKLKKEEFLEYVKNFGFFEKTGIELPEIYSQNSELKKGAPINLATASFGQGIEVTSIQLAVAFAAIANGGYLVKPTLVEKIGDSLQIEFSNEKKRVILPETSQTLTRMLISVVENGFGKTAKIKGYYIAGKTGTAQISFSNLGIPKKGYSELTIQTFVGYFPAFKPKYLILVKLFNPKSKTAEYSAAPIFREMAEFLISYSKIPPDYQIIEEK
jgi:cell division protein FtsI/penicillin-binding protein 2